MPFNWYSLQPVSPNPGRWTRDRVHEACRNNGAELHGFWFDHESEPQNAYVLAKDGDADRLAEVLHAKAVLTLYEGS